MNRTRRTIVVRSAVGAGLVVAGLFVWLAPARRPATTGALDGARRHAVLASLANRLVPATGGGWAVAEPASRSRPDRWLLAAAALGPDGRDAVPAAAAALAGSPSVTARDRALAQATVLGAPGTRLPRQDAIAVVILRRATRGLVQHDIAWLSPLLNLSRWRGASGRGAVREVDRLAGHPTCGRLPTPVQPLAAPDADLTVAVRALAGREVRCSRAASVLTRALLDPRWSGPVAVPELADLADVASPLPDALHLAFERRLAAATSAAARGGDAAQLVRLRQVSAAFGHRSPLPAATRYRLARQVASEGRLPDRWSGAAAPVDAAVAVQLRHAHLLPSGFERATVAAARRGPEAAGSLGPLLLGDGLPDCRSARRAPTSAARPSPDRMALEQVRAVIVARCRGALDLRVLVRDVRTRFGPDQRDVRIALTLLAACRVDPHLVTSGLGFEPHVTGVFEHDPLGLLSEAVDLDPVRSCEAAAP